jgi:hypothetical protein
MAYANGTAFATVDGMPRTSDRLPTELRPSAFAASCTVLAALLGAAGCSSSSSAGPAVATTSRVFVGAVTGTDAQVGLVATETGAVVYFCGGDSSFATKTHWIPSAAIGATGLMAASDTSGWSLSGQLDDGGASGNVVMGDGGTFAFHANPVAAQTIAGLYDAQGPCGKVGVIVSQPGPSDAPAIQGACLPAVGTGSGSVEQVNPVRPLERATDGTIAVLAGGAQISVRATAAPAD